MCLCFPSLSIIHVYYIFFSWPSNLGQEGPLKIAMIVCFFPPSFPKRITFQLLQQARDSGHFVDAFTRTLYFTVDLASLNGSDTPLRYSPSIFNWGQIWSERSSNAPNINNIIAA